MTRTVLALATAAAVAGGMLAPAASGAVATRASTTVTIKTQNGDFWGTLLTSRPRVCGKDRKVVVLKQVGATQDPSVDVRVASDLASRNGDVFEWSTGNTGLTGKFYARVTRTPDCKGDTSDTVRATK